MSVAVRVENLCKKYVISHQANNAPDTLREIITEKAKSFFGKKNNDHNKSTEEFWALKDVSFEIKTGDRVGIIGKNGAGKSTLLKILSKITEPTSGKISVKGRIASLLEVGTGFHPELTGRENIFLNGSVLGMNKSEIKSNFDEIVEFSGVEKFLDTAVKRYSSGMYVRLAFAVAAHLETEILILDEVLAVGDAEFQQKCLGKIRDESKNKGRTIIFVSHSMPAIKSLCNSSILLSNGTIQGMGNTEAVTGLYYSGIPKGTGEFIIGKNSEQERIIIEKVILCDSNRNIKNNFEFADDIKLEVEMNALDDFQNPYIWVAIKNSHGPVTSASGLMDGFHPDIIKKGISKVKCTFMNVPLLTGKYTIYMGVRGNDGLTIITDTKEVAVFNITSVMSKLGFNGSLADRLAPDAVSPMIPYQWEFDDGKKRSFNIKNYVK
jgi:lipopolysaccharide transport system ATP-binding protein